MRKGYDSQVQSNDSKPAVTGNLERATSSRVLTGLSARALALAVMLTAFSDGWAVLGQLEQNGRRCLWAMSAALALLTPHAWVVPAVLLLDCAAHHALRELDLPHQ